MSNPIVSIQSEIPESLLDKLSAWLEHHRNCDFDQAIAAALAAFLEGEGCDAA